MLISIIEFAIATLLIIGLFNEEKIAAFERRIINKIRRKTK